MKIQPGELPQRLEKGLMPVYLISGDEPLLVQESCDLIRDAARTAGFQDRIVFHADRQLNWNTVAEEFNALSLFAEKRRIEINLTNGKLGDGRDVIENALLSPPEDVLLLLISTTRLDAAETRRKWYKQLQKTGLHVPVWPVESDRFPGWLQQRARARNLSLTRGALALLAEQMEGNLLAANQELDRLVLFYGTENIDEEAIEKVVENSARYNPFELTSELLAGHCEHAQRLIGGLEQEGENVLGLLALLGKDLNLLSELQQALRRREAPAALLKQRGVRQPRKARVLEQAARRLSPETLRRAMTTCSDIDRAAKGFDPHSPWFHLRNLATELAAPRARH